MVKLSKNARFYFIVIILLLITLFSYSIKNIYIFFYFLAGAASILTPCVFALLPAYFGLTLKEGKNVLKMLTFFSIGLFITLLPFALISNLFKSVYQNLRFNIIFAVGIFLIIFGIFSILGMNLSSFIMFRKNQYRNDSLGIFLFGTAFGFSGIILSPCNGPVLMGISSLASIFSPVPFASLLVYIMGIITPLVILSVFFEETKFFERKFAEKMLFSFDMGNRNFRIYLPSFVAGVVFIAVGMGLAVYKRIDFLSEIAYKIGIPTVTPFLIKQSLLINFLGAFILIVVLGLISYITLKRKV